MVDNILKNSGTWDPLFVIPNSGVSFIPGRDLNPHHDLIMSDGSKYPKTKVMELVRSQFPRHLYVMPQCVHLLEHALRIT